MLIFIAICYESNPVFLVGTLMIFLLHCKTKLYSNYPAEYIENSTRDIFNFQHDISQILQIINKMIVLQLTLIWACSLETSQLSPIDQDVTLTSLILLLFLLAMV